MEAFKRLMASYRQDVFSGDLPFMSGAVGWVSYDTGRLLERLRQPATPARQIPDVCFALYESVIGYDLERKEIQILPTRLNGPNGDMSDRQEARAQALLAKIQEKMTSPPRSPARPGFRMTTPLTSNVSRDEYVQAVESVRDFIARGEIYQANFTQRFSAQWRGDGYELYRRLRAASPAPFAAYLNFGGIKVLSSSPERFLWSNGTRVETRPIKGTRPRGADPTADRANALELVKSEKDMAEHMMIVDLERNDLGRVCEPGSVKVQEQAGLEVFPHVFHLTSTVAGKLRRGLTSVDALRAMFPGGSITGAPKIRAEEILAQLESAPRGLYTGALGYVGFTGACDLSIVIRTIVLTGRSLSFGVGGGVVTDSDPELEYAESLHKAQGMLMALGPSPDPSEPSQLAAVGKCSGSHARIVGPE